MNVSLHLTSRKN
uniref:Uncharacterized protein n=1 Tax=Rhizophora mucronata TaxID=61149 RepID=A0A2P2N654_RHIMU